MISKELMKDSQKFDILKKFDHNNIIELFVKLKFDLLFSLWDIHRNLIILIFTDIKFWLYVDNISGPTHCNSLEYCDDIV